MPLKIKDVIDPVGHKVIEPTTGKVGFIKAMLNNNFDGKKLYTVYLGMNKNNMKKMYPFNVFSEDFYNWNIASESDKPNINDLIKRNV